MTLTCDSPTGKIALRVVRHQILAYTVVLGLGLLAAIVTDDKNLSVFHFIMIRVVRVVLVSCPFAPTLRKCETNVSRPDRNFMH